MSWGTGEATPARAPRLAAARAATWLLLPLLAVSGCRRSQQAPAPRPESGAVVAAGPWSVAADRGWQPRGDGIAVEAGAAILVDVRRELHAPRLVLVPTASCRGGRLGLEWATNSGPPARETVELTAAEVEVSLARARRPGRYQLEVVEPPPEGCVLRTLGYRSEESQGSWDAGTLPSGWPLADFLEYGVVGPDTPQAMRGSGTLIDGEGTLRQPLRYDAAATVRAWVANLGDTPAAVELRAGGAVARTTVAPRAWARVEAKSRAAGGAVEWHAGGGARARWLVGSPVVVAPAGADGRPTLVLITLDTTRRDALGVYAPAKAVTPALDALARQADVYEHAYTVAPWTLPSHASLFTGLYPSRHGAGVWSTMLLAEETLARRLARAGYFGVGLAGGPLCGARFGVARGFDLYRDAPGIEATADVMTSEATSLLDAGGGPLFLFANYFDAHAYYRAPKPYARRLGVPQRRVALEGGPAVWRNVARGVSAAWSRVASGEVAATPAARAWMESAYRAEVAFMDAELGRLFDVLRSRGLFDDALIVIVADHGEQLGENGRFGHGYTLAPELVEVPLIVKWPRQRQGRRVDRLVSAVDVFPTLLAAAGVATPPVDGVDLSPEREAAGRRFVLAEEHEARVHPLAATRLRIATDLFGLLARDRMEVRWQGGGDCRARAAGGWQRTGCSGEPGRLAELERLLGGGAAARRGERGAVPPEEEAKLRALGYL